MLPNPQLLDAGISTDPLALIIAAGAAALSVLLGIVISVVAHTAKRIENEQKEQGHNINQLYVAKAQLEGRQSTNEAEIRALKEKTLSKELFDAATAHQNAKLDSVEQKTNEVNRKVDNIDRGLIAGSRSYSPSEIPVARPGTYRKPGGE